MRAIGIDLGSDTVKIVEISISRKNISINSIHEKKLTQQISEHDKEIEAIEFVRQTLQTKDVESTRIVLGLKQDKVTTRTKQFPFSDRLKILKSLSFEMEEDIPFDPDLCAFDAKTILYEGFSAHVLAVAAPHSHIEKTLSLAKDFGINPYTLSVDGIAFANVIENIEDPIPQYSPQAGPLYKPEAEHEGNHTVDLNSANFGQAQQSKSKNMRVILNLGHKRTLFYAIIDGRVVFVRSLLWGADLIIQELARKFQLPYIEAQKLLKTQAQILLQKNGANFESVNLSSTIEKVLSDLTHELQITLLELQSDFNAEIKSIDLTGGLSQLRNIGAFITQHVEIAVNTHHLATDIFSQSHFESHGLTTTDIQARYTTAIGLALEAFKKPRNPALQLMRGEFAPDSNQLTQIWQDWKTAILSSCVVLVLIFGWASFRETFSTTLSELGQTALKDHAKKVAKLPKKQQNEKGVKKYIADHKKRSQDLKIVNQIIEMNSALEILKKVSESAPSKGQSQIDLMELDIADDIVKISGYAGSPKDVTDLSEKLKIISLDKKIIEESATLPTQSNKVTFSLSFKTDRGLLK